MTNAEIVSNLRKMVDRFAAMLNEPLIEGALPTLRVTFRPDQDSDCLTLTVGAEFAADEE